MKYCRPVYKAINKVDPELARKTFLESGVYFLHPIAREMIAKVC
jgi:leukotriene-A4 hydrolase